MDSPDVEPFLDLAAQLGETGHEVDVFLVANAALLAVDPLSDALQRLSGCDRVRVRVDRFSLDCRRGLPAASTEAERGSRRPLPDWIQLSDMGELVRLVMQPGTTPVWH